MLGSGLVPFHLHHLFLSEFVLSSLFLLLFCFPHPRIRGRLAKEIRCAFPPELWQLVQSDWLLIH